jgi:bacterioferritin
MRQTAAALHALRRLFFSAAMAVRDNSRELCLCICACEGGRVMAEAVTREQLIARLNEDLAREYQAIIAYVVYSQVLKGAQYMNIAKELEVHAGEELQHALTIAKHIDYLGGMPTATALPVKLSEKVEEMLRADLENENDTIINYRVRVRECEALQEYAIAEDIVEILRQEQEHQVDLATALGETPPDLSKRR